MNKKFEPWKLKHRVLTLKELVQEKDRSRLIAKHGGRLIDIADQAAANVNNFISTMIRNNHKHKFTAWKHEYFIGVKEHYKIHTLIGLSPKEFLVKYAANTANKMIVKMIESAKRKA